jgi:hypothetical protein
MLTLKRHHTGRFTKTGRKETRGEWLTADGRFKIYREGHPPRWHVMPWSMEAFGIEGSHEQRKQRGKDFALLDLSGIYDTDFPTRSEALFALEMTMQGEKK